MDFPVIAVAAPLLLSPPLVSGAQEYRHYPFVPSWNDYVHTNTSFTAKIPWPTSCEVKVRCEWPPPPPPPPPPPKKQWEVWTFTLPSNNVDPCATHPLGCGLGEGLPPHVWQPWPSASTGFVVDPCATHPLGCEPDDSGPLLPPAHRPHEYDPLQERRPFEPPDIGSPGWLMPESTGPELVMFPGTLECLTKPEPEDCLSSEPKPKS